MLPLTKHPALILRNAKSVTAQDANLSEDDIRQGLQSMEAVWDHLYHREQARLLQLLIEHIQLDTEGVRTNGLHSSSSI